MRLRVWMRHSREEFKVVTELSVGYCVRGEAVALIPFGYVDNELTMYGRENVSHDAQR